ncbi:MAG: type II toxin-antitoxin system VapC family toxin [Elusimicrobia bacterium]|nr:type II toxin-antitoxin system VapC family toxin [Elusimicrobiota bacterium]
MTVYLESSALLRRLLGEAGTIDGWGDWRRCYTSEITVVESLRAFDRLRLQGKLEDAEVSLMRKSLKRALESIGLIALNPAVLNRASQAFPTVVGTLDAIHLASVLMYADKRKVQPVFLTHDVRLGIAAQALGLEVRGLARDVLH